jgi:DnaK suppressor protein
MAVKKATKKKAAAKPKAKKAVKKAARKAPAVKTAGKPAARKTAKKPVKKAAPRTSRPVSEEAGSQPFKLSPEMRKRNELLKKILLKKRNEVVEGLETQMGRRLTRETGQRIDAAMDSADLSSQDMDQGIDYSLLEMRYEQYKDIADAFRKLQNNTFGLCEECGEEIDLKRLQVNPLARFCIPCKTKKEEIERIQKEETRFKE